MELKQIDYFVTLARTLHFTKAAEACHVTQPALTRAIQKLESEFGGPLFYRERGHTQLTDLGRLMVKPLERALNAAQEARDEAAAYRRRDAFPLRIGLEHSLPTALLTPAMAELRRRTASIELTLRQGSQPHLCDGMLSGELDMALLVERPGLSERLHRWPLFDEAYILVCAPQHGFQRQATVSLRELTRECLVLNEDPECPVRRFLGESMGLLGATPTCRQFGSTQEHIFELVMASLGVAVTGERMPSRAPLVRRPLTCQPPSRKVVVAIVAGRPIGPTPSLFLKLMRASEWSTSTAEVDAAENRLSIG